MLTRIALATALLGLAACTSTPLTSTAPAAGGAASPSASGGVSPTAGQAGATSPSAQSKVATVALPTAATAAPAGDRSVYFGYDEFAVKPDFVPLIERHGRYLAARPTLHVKVEGNADERGSREYNLALGQKRAEAVLKALRIYGVKDSQAEPVSWGEDKPVDRGHDESAWSRNRRADLNYGG
jgi:peptidoglycan-associated lipoprotein